MDKEKDVVFQEPLNKFQEKLSALPFQILISLQPRPLRILRYREKQPQIQFLCRGEPFLTGPLEKAPLLLNLFLGGNQTR
jgi:hypothetical protein